MSGKGRPFTTNWTDAELADLDRRWRRGEVASAIGRALGKTKNSIIGKAHRLKLPPRRSPIGMTKAARARARSELGPEPMPERLPGVSRFLGPEPEPEAARPLKLAETAKSARYKPCLWPMWPDGAKPTHEYCGERRQVGSSYCQAHHKRAYTGYSGWGQRISLKNLVA